MNKIELQKQSLNMKEVLTTQDICGAGSMEFTFEIIKTIWMYKRENWIFYILRVSTVDDVF